MELLIKGWKLASRARDSFMYFIQHNWYFETTQIQNMIKDLSPRERVRFDLDVSTFSPRIHIHQYIHGLKRYCLKGEKDDIP